MRVATIDIGTNTVLLLVAEQNDPGDVRVVTERATITRLGEGVDRTRRLAAGAVARTRACLESYADVLRPLAPQRIAVVGTSAMRDAGGGEEVRGLVRSLFGVDAQVLSGDEEAKLTFRGALSGLMTKGEALGVFDIGGGSTELVLGRVESNRPTVAWAHSYDVGSVRLTERHLTHDRPTSAELDAVKSSAREALNSAGVLPVGGTAVGVAGTVTTLAAVALGLESYDANRVHGLELETKTVREVVSRLASLTVHERRQLPGMEPNRADVIVAGGVLTLAVLEHWGARSFRVSDRGVRWGLAEELLGASP